MTTPDDKTLQITPAGAAPPRFFVLIPCAGQGSRAASATAPGFFKQYQLINGTPMVIHTVEAFRGLGALGTSIASLGVVVSPADEDFQDVFPGFGGPGEHLLRNGGSTRAESVLNGLKALCAAPDGALPSDWVLVHDAARCLVTAPQILALIEALKDDEVGGLLAQPLPDTLKAEHAGRVRATVDRADKWLAQTPQMFRVGRLMEALESAALKGFAVTDESSAMEAMGWSPRLVPGSALNFKVTFPQDFALAEAVLRARPS